MWFSTGLTELCSTPEDRAEVLQVHLYSYQVTHIHVKEKNLKGQSSLIVLYQNFDGGCVLAHSHMAALLFFFFSLFCCPSPCNAVKESGEKKEKKVEGSPKQWLFSQEDRTLYSLSCALCPSDTVISSMSGKGKQSPFPVPTHVCYTSNGTGTVACPLSQLSQTRAAPISEMSC